MEIATYYDKLIAWFNVSDRVAQQEEEQKQVQTEVLNESGNWNSFFKIKINMESQFYQINLLKLFNKWKIHLGVITIGAVILAAIFSGPAFITPKFKSFAVVYPANISAYSDESETEQMLQIMQSKDISDNVIRRFNLAEHYEIDSSYKYFYTTLMYEYSQNISISKTPYEGVSIEVLDIDPQIASDITNSIIEFYNDKVKYLHGVKFGEVVNMYERALKKKENYIDSLESRFYKLSNEYGLLDYTSQSREIARGYLKTIDGSASNNINTKEVLRLKKNIEEKGGEFIYLQKMLQEEAVKYTELKRDYERAYMDYDRQFTYSNIITQPFPADKKAYPVRWLIVVMAGLASFFVSYIIILIIENYKGMAKGS